MATRYNIKPRICLNCNKPFRVSRGNRTKFCTRKCHSLWSIANYTPPEWKWKIENWAVIKFDSRVKRSTQTGCVNYWKIRCVNCEIESVRAQNMIQQDHKCQNCKGKPKGHSGVLRLYTVYKNNATKYRKSGLIPFLLELSEFRQITSSPCHYCGVLPSKMVNDGHGKINAWGQYFYNGIDRKDPNVGYTVENSLPCCENCNFAKGTMSYQRFIAYLDRVAKFRQLHIRDAESSFS